MNIDYAAHTIRLQQEREAAIARAKTTRPHSAARLIAEAELARLTARTLQMERATITDGDRSRLPEYLRSVEQSAAAYAAMKGMKPCQ